MVKAKCYSFLFGVTAAGLFDAIVYPVIHRSIWIGVALTAVTAAMAFMSGPATKESGGRKGDWAVNIDQKYFDIDYPLPKDGQRIFWKAKGTSEWREAVCDFVWLAEDVPAVKLKGGGNFFPEFGDEWKPRTTKEG